jgi:putative ABC transport system permease protein
MKYLNYLLKSSFEDLRRNKVRTFLTSLGILIGVLSVVLMMAFGFGLKDYINKQFDVLGKNLIMILPGSGFTGGNGGQGLIGGIQFDEKDLAKIRRIKDVKMAAPVTMKGVKVQAGGKTETSSLLGTTANMFQIMNQEAQVGRIFTETDVQKKKKVIVVGSQIAEKLYGSSSNSIGKVVRIQNQRFTIIGVMKKIGSIGSSDDSNSYAPYTALLSLNPNKPPTTKLFPRRKLK